MAAEVLVAPTTEGAIVAAEGQVSVAAATPDAPSSSLSVDPVDLSVVTTMLREGVLAFGDVDAALGGLAEVRSLCLLLFC